MKVSGAQCKVLSRTPIYSHHIPPTFHYQLCRVFSSITFSEITPQCERMIEWYYWNTKKGITLSQMDWQLSLFALMVCFMVFEEKNCFGRKIATKTFLFASWQYFVDCITDTQKNLPFFDICWSKSCTNLGLFYWIKVTFLKKSL